METDSISRQKRDSLGVRVMSPQDGATISAFALVPSDEDGE